MPGWDEIEVEGEDFGEGAGTLIGTPISGYFEEKTWDDGRVSATLWLTLYRSHPELTPNAPVESRALWNCGPGWRVVNPDQQNQGTAVVHSEGKTKFNANTGIGKLLVAVKAVYPEPPEGFDPTTIKSWLDLADQGDVEWGNLEEAPLMPNPDPTAKQKFIPNTAPDAKPKRTRVPVAYIGDGKANGQVSEPVDLSTLGTFDEKALAAAVKDVTGAQEIQAALIGIPGVVANKELYAVILRDPEGLAAALVGF